jgi:hypothetical protein
MWLNSIFRSAPRLIIGCFISIQLLVIFIFLNKLTFQFDFNNIKNLIIELDIKSFSFLVVTATILSLFAVVGSMLGTLITHAIGASLNIILPHRFIIYTQQKFPFIYTLIAPLNEYAFYLIKRQDFRWKAIWKAWSEASNPLIYNEYKANTYLSSLDEILNELSDSRSIFITLSGYKLFEQEYSRVIMNMHSLQTTHMLILLIFLTIITGILIGFSELTIFILVIIAFAIWLTSTRLREEIATGYIYWMLTAHLYTEATAIQERATESPIL